MQEMAKNAMPASDGQDAAELTFSGWLRYIACWCGAYMMGRIGLTKKSL